MSRDQSGRSKWSREQAQNSNAIDRFFPGANSSVISVVFYSKLKTVNLWLTIKFLSTWLFMLKNENENQSLVLLDGRVNILVSCHAIHVQSL